MNDLIIDPTRVAAIKAQGADGTGIYVRAKTQDGAWDSVDILALDRESLLHWLRSHDKYDISAGCAFRERVILTIFGHKP